jgi:hypothetical protein
LGDQPFWRKVSGLLVDIRAHLVAFRRMYPYLQIGTKLAISTTAQVVATVATRTTTLGLRQLPSLPP